MLNVQSYVAGRWIDPGTAARPIASAITGAPLAQAGAGAGPIEISTYLNQQLVSISPDITTSILQTVFIPV